MLTSEGSYGAGRASTLEVDGLQLAMLSFGPADGHPVLCLHGWLDNAASFVPLAHHLPHLRLLAFDMPGHGQSQHRPPGAAYHQLDWVINLHAIVERLGLSRFSLMGHSMGAGIAALTCGTFPERVASLVLLEGLGPRPTEPDQIPIALRAHCETKLSPPSRASERGASFETALRARLAFGDPIERLAAELLCQRGVRPAPGGVTFSADRRLQKAQPLQLTEEQILAFYRRIACPTLLVAGTEGLRYDPDLMAARRAAIGRLTVVELDGGHHVHMDRADAVATEIDTFFAALDGAD